MKALDLTPYLMENGQVQSYNTVLWAESQLPIGIGGFKCMVGFLIALAIVLLVLSRFFRA